MSVKKIMYLSLGFIGLALGAVGAALPVIPAFPFLLLAAFGFGKGSDRLNTWFKGTALYKNNLESFVAGQGMTTKTKVKIMVTVTILLSISLYITWHVSVMRIVLAVIWLGHMVYFMFGVKTKMNPEQ